MKPKKNKINSDHSVAIIVPTIREVHIQNFLDLWKNDFSNTIYRVELYIIEDNREKTFDIKQNPNFKIFHYSWEDIEKELNKDSWIIPRRTDAIRSYGVYKAYQNNCDFFITLDDDCYPYVNPVPTTENFVDNHINNLINYDYNEDVWVNTILKYKPRGYPYGDTILHKNLNNIAINHGLWVNVPDFDSITSLSLQKKNQYYDHTQNLVIPLNKFYPMCSMNLAWRREVAPLMYFLLMGQDLHGNKFGFDRFGDIWCGLIAEKILSKIGLLSASGRPFVLHDRASNAFVNLNKEAPGIQINEQFWRDLYTMELESTSSIELYKEVILKFPKYSDYWELLAKAMTVWINLF